MRRIVAAHVVALCLTIGAALLSAQNPPPAAGIWAGVFTPAQAQRGQEVFQGTCSNCHSADLSGGAGPSLAGERFKEAWESQALTRLFRKIRDTMPGGNPGSLSDQATIDIVAFILQANQFPPGDSELQAAAGVLASVSIVPEGAASVQEVRDFSLVGVVGCLEGSGRQWTLSRASDPVVANPGPLTAVEIQGAASLEGTEAFRLVSVLPFEPASARNQRVHLKGLIRRTSDGAFLNVTALQAVDAACGR